MPSSPTELRDLPRKYLITLQAIPSLLLELGEEEPHLGPVLGPVVGLCLSHPFVVAQVSVALVVLEPNTLQPTVS